MKKTKAFIVNFKDMFTNWGAGKDGLVTRVMKNPNIEKRCPTCNAVLFFATTQERGQEDASLYCPTCKEKP